MIRLSFRTKLLASHIGLVAAVVLIVIFELNRSLGSDLRRQLDERLEEQARGAAQWISSGRRPRSGQDRDLDKLAGRLSIIVGAGVTIIERDGTVLGDSEFAAGLPPEFPNQADQPEVASARAGTTGRATRIPATSADEMHYVAVAAGDELIVRLAVPLSDIHTTLASMRQRLLFASALAVTAALALGFLASRIASGPLRAMTGSATRIAQGDYDIGTVSRSPDEFGVLSRTLASLAAQLKARIGDLTAERDRLSAILTGMVEGVLVFDADRRVIVANPAAARILGAEGVLVDKPLACVATPSLRVLVEEAEHAGELREAEIEGEDGRRFIAVYVRPLAAAAGGGVVAVLRDMTDVRRFERMRRDFVANVSHELRTPVTAIQGYAETLLRSSTDLATAQNFLQIIHRHAQRLGGFLNDVLQLSELEARPDDTSVREPVPLCAVAEHVVETMRERTEAARVVVCVEVDPAAIALGDPAGIEQVIENLVDNAAKYGRSGGTIRILGERRGERVALTVADDGPGIERAHLPRLFERFYRVNPSRSRDLGGTGLGLAIVQHLVQSMGGSVSVDSSVGAGCRFHVDLPAHGEG